VAADSVIIPVQCEYYALEGLSHLLHTIGLVRENLASETEIMGALLTMYDKRSRLNRSVVKEVQRNFSGRVFSSIVPRSISLAESPSYGKTILHYDPHQPRGDFNEEELGSLADSIKEHGILQPLIVSKQEIILESGRRVEYYIIAGERRWRAAKLAGFRQVPVIIRESDDQNKLELALVENIQRTDLNPLEEAKAYQKLVDIFSLTQEQIAARVAKSREAIANKLRLLTLPYEVKKMLLEGKISEGHAKALVSLRNPERQIFLAGEVAKKSWNVRVLEEKVSAITQPQKPKSEKVLDAELEQYKNTIQETLGTEVVISGSREKGKLAISFYSPEDLERIIKKLTE